MVECQGTEDDSADWLVSFADRADPLNHVPSRTRPARVEPAEAPSGCAPEPPIATVGIGRSGEDLKSQIAGPLWAPPAWDRCPRDSHRQQ